MAFPKGSHNPKAKHLITLVCQNCEQTFQVFQSQSEKRFCSNKCYDRGQYNPFKGKRHTEEARAKMSLKRRGKPGRPLSTEEVRQLHLARKQKLANDPALRAKYGHHLAKFQHLGRTPEARAKQAESIRLTLQNPSIRAKYGHTISGEEKAKLREAQSRIWSDPQTRHRRIEIIRQTHSSHELREKLSANAKKQWKTPETRERLLNGLARGLNRRPTKPEKYIDEILNKFFPSQWKYVGDGKMRIGRYFPDFINCNGKKLIIEVFGNYWHSKGDEVLKVETYAELGYKTLVLWENDLKGKPEEEISERIKVFSS